MFREFSIRATMPQSRILTRCTVEFCTTGSPRSASPFSQSAPRESRDSRCYPGSSDSSRRGILPRVFTAAGMQMSKDSPEAGQEQNGERIAKGEGRGGGRGRLSTLVNRFSIGEGKHRVSVMRYHERRLSLSHEKRRILWIQGFDGVRGARGFFCSNAHLFSILHTDKFLYPRSLYICQLMRFVPSRGLFRSVFPLFDRFSFIFQSAN